MANPLLRVDVTELLAGHRLRGFHLQVVALAALAMFVDGFDTQALGFVAPEITRSLALRSGALGPAFAATGVGSLIGILAATPLADRYGRKPVIVGALLIFAVFGFFCATASTVQGLVVWRFLAGIGLAGVVPNALAITAEFMPQRLRSTLVMIVWFGFSLGSGLAGPICAYILASHPWSAVFLFGAVLPLAVAPLIFVALPESLLVLTRRGPRAHQRIRTALMRISRRYDFLHVTQFVSSEPREHGFPVRLLFAAGRAPITSLLWLMFFMNLCAVFFINAWLPTVLSNLGLSQTWALSIAGLVHFGGVAGGFLVAPLADKLNRYFVLAVAFVLGGSAIAAIGHVGAAPAAIAAATFFAGVFTLGTQNAANAIAATSYPTSMRATGVGWALGMGRIGQIVSPYAASLLLNANLPVGAILHIYALPSIVAAGAALAIGLSRRRFGAEPELTPVAAAP